MEEENNEESSPIESVPINPIVYERPVIDEITSNIDTDTGNDNDDANASVDNDEQSKEEDNKPKSIFSDLETEDKYVTYRVYRVLEDDTIDKILEKYHISKEELAKYNSIDSIKTGTKLIIPANE